MKTSRKLSAIARLTLLTISLLLIPGRLAMAKGPFAKIVISGGSLTSSIEISREASLLAFFSFSEFFRAGTAKPEILGEAYEITRYFQDSGTGQLIAWDHLHYYPNSNGSGGYVFYDGLINGGSEYDGKWYVASRAGDEALRRVLAGSNANSTVALQSLFFIVALGLVMAGVMVALSIIARRNALKSVAAT